MTDLLRSELKSQSDEINIMRIKLDERGKDVLIREREIKFLKGELVANKQEEITSIKFRIFLGKKSQNERTNELKSELESMTVDIGSAKALIRDLEGNDIKIR